MIEYMIHEYFREHGSYPESIDAALREQGIVDTEEYRFPNRFPLPEDGRVGDRPLKWIYLPPRPGREDVPLLIAPLPAYNHNEPEELLRIVAYQNHSVNLIRETEMPKIWEAVFKR